MQKIEALLAEAGTETMFNKEAPDDDQEVISALPTS